MARVRLHFWHLVQCCVVVVFGALESRGRRLRRAPHDAVAIALVGRARVHSGIVQAVGHDAEGTW
jgi:hypothetical protein